MAEGASASCSKAASFALQGHRAGLPSCSGTWFLPGRPALCPAWAARALLRLAAGKDVGAPGGCPSPWSCSPRPFHPSRLARGSWSAWRGVPSTPLCFWPDPALPPRWQELTRPRLVPPLALLRAAPAADAVPAEPLPGAGAAQAELGLVPLLLNAAACATRSRCQYRSGRAVDGCHFCPRCQEPLLVPLGLSLVPVAAWPRPSVPAPALIFTHMHMNTCTPQHPPPHADRAQHAPLPPSSHGAPEVVRSGGCSDTENSLTHIHLPTHLHIHTHIPQHQPPLPCPWRPGKLQGFLGTGGATGALGRVWMALRECPGRNQLLGDTHKYVFQTPSSHRVMAGLFQPLF